ncbi:MAG: FeoA family protein [Pseudomonadota bacterium]|jgi:ferrous iron transport protein A|nr:FeoA family protein [Pseudomonadota bacterium]|tara:strand:- start:15 stop:248 length:234 start_codon:yes stop_codon:yes gene_type:complete
MTLWELGKSKSARVTQIDASLDQQIIARLSEMGLSTGRDVQCIRRGPLGGPMVMQLGGSVFAMEHDLATRIQISPTD